jgi:uncharacterized protein (TIGR03000 family)
MKRLLLPLVGLVLLSCAADASAQFRRRYPWPVYPYFYPPYAMLPPDPNNIPYTNPYAPAPSQMPGYEGGSSPYVPAASNRYAPRPNPYAPSYDGTMPAPKDNRAVIQIRLPSSAADVWVDDQKMKDKLAASRVFVSPPLEPGHDYVYTIKAHWVHLDDNVTQERAVVVNANKISTVDFTQPAGK